MLGGSDIEHLEQGFEGEDAAQALEGEVEQTLASLAGNKYEAITKRMEDLKEFERAGKNERDAAEKKAQQELKEKQEEWEVQWAGNKYVQQVIADVIADEAESKQKRESASLASRRSLRSGPSSPSVRYADDFDY
jgi:hypothetical protein